MIPQTARVAFMGTPDFSVHILKSLLDAPYQVVAVYTQPPRPVGRGYKVTPSPVHKFATERHIPVFTPESLKTEDAQNQWKALDLDVAIVVAYGLLLPKGIIETPRWGCLNVHPSLLPRWRGAAPLQRTILADDRETGVAIMKLDEGFDTGDVLLTKKIPLTDTITTSQLSNTLAQLGAEALLEALSPYLEGKLQPTPQPSSGIVYAEKLKKEEGLLDWRLPASLLGRKVRALNPWPGTWFDVGEDQIKVLEAEVLPLLSPLPPGTLLDDQFTIACGEGALRLLYVQKVGRSCLSAEEFLRGYDLPPLLISHETI